MNTRAENLSAGPDAEAISVGISLRSTLALGGALWRLTKPGVTRLVILTTALGAVMAPGTPGVAPMLLTLLGTVLVVGCANALNMYLERDVDALMARTRLRPLPSGQLSMGAALAFGLLLGAAGVFILGTAVNPLTGELAMMAVLTYVLVYTPMKAVSPIALYLGAVPGALPPLLGYAGVQGALSPGAWSVFAILFVWQIPHFLAITVFREQDYARAGLRVLPVVKGVARTVLGIRLWSLVLVATTFAPPLFGLGGPAYLVTAGVTGACFLAWVFAGISRSAGIEQWAKRTFFLTMPHLVLLYGVLALTAP